MKTATNTVKRLLAYLCLNKTIDCRCQSRVTFWPSILREVGYSPVNADSQEVLYK